MTTLNQKPGIGERNCKIPFNAHRVGLRDMLQMQHRADQQFLTALQDTTRRAYASLVLVEAHRRRVLKRGIEVLTGPTLHLQYIRRAQAARIEEQLAEALRAEGLFVQGGH